METLSKRTQSLLMNAGINSLQELSEYTAADLLKFRNFGYKSLQEVEPYLKTFDFTIKSDNTEANKAELQQWKDSALEVMNQINLQEVGKVLNLQLGSSVSEQILPSIKKLVADKAELVSYLEHVLFYVFWNGGNLNLKDKEKIESLIQKMKQ